MPRHVYRVNRPLYDLPEEHPAHQFLIAFEVCQQHCVGRELPPPLGDGIDLTWWSDHCERSWSFSGFAYMYISFTVELDGWLTDAPERTESERRTLQGLDDIDMLMSECRLAATVESNDAILEMVDQVEDMARLWRQCIEVRCPE